ncbi:MAG TPA: MerR family transcriptional regulator [Candidatus Limnocylindrales bacterium]
MYTIRQASARTGVAVPTIRAWERRYGVVVPARTPAGYRLYDEAALQRLGMMRRLVDEGWQPSVAAAAILDGGPAALAAAATATDGPAAAAERATALEPSDGAVPARDVPIARRFVEAARTMDEAELSRTLDDAFARGSFERAMSDVLFPALEDLGSAWASGAVSVAGEHLASHAVLRRLANALDAAGSGDPSARPVVVGLPPGSRHELGALAFAVALRRGGTPVAYLGPDLPLDDWVRAAKGAAAAVIGVVTRRDRRAAELVARRLVEAEPGVVVALGGEAADVVTAPGAIHLPARLEDGVAALRAALAASSTAADSQRSERRSGA